MKETPLFQVMKRLKRFPLRHQIAHLQALAAAELPHSRRRREIDAWKQDLMTRQLKKENRSIA